ncbi:MAG: elongation factor P [bacterium]
MSIITSNELRNGTVFMMDNAPWIVLKFDHNKTGRGGAVNKVKAKNLKTGSITEKGFSTNEKFEEADLSKESCQYLYSDEETAYFMSNATFEQYELSKEKVENGLLYLKEGDKTVVVFLDGVPISIEIPSAVILTIEYTEVAVKGNTSTGAMKKARLETGLDILVPLFINIGDKVKINTESNTYTERVK